MRAMEALASMDLHAVQMRDRGLRPPLEIELWPTSSNLPSKIALSAQQSKPYCVGDFSCQPQPIILPIPK